MLPVIYISLLISGISCHVVPKSYQLDLLKNHPSVKRLQEYIRIDTSCEANLELAVEFWKHQAKELGLPFSIYRPAGLPVFVATLKGRNPELPSILLNSHGDVVPTDAKFWTHPPYSAYIDDKGDMYGRGTQDTKSVGIQYLEAIRKIIQNNITLERTVHIMVVPDEETGSFKGLVPFVETEYFKSLNVGFALDEGLTSSDDMFLLTYVDKRPWQMRFDIRGPSGHGSSLQNGTVMMQVQKLLNMAMNYREQQVEIMNSRSPYDFGPYSSLNINIIQGGLANNVIPSSMTMVIDVRLSTQEKASDFESLISQWLAELSSNSSLEFIRREDYSAVTPLDDSNPYWITMRDTLRNLYVFTLF